jgi:hypothetical protein
MADLYAEIIMEAVLEGIAAEAEFEAWVAAVDADMWNQDYWDFL